VNARHCAESDPSAVDWFFTVVKNKKADVVGHLLVSHHVGLLTNEPPDTAGLPFIKFSDDFNSRLQRVISP